MTVPNIQLAIHVTIQEARVSAAAAPRGPAGIAANALANTLRSKLLAVSAHHGERVPARAWRNGSARWPHI